MAPHRALCVLTSTAAFLLFLLYYAETAEARRPPRNPEALPVQRLVLDPEMCGVIACAFSPDGTKLVTVASDVKHTVTVWDWAEGVALCEDTGSQGEPPQVYGVAWDPFSEGDRFCTYGV